MNPGSETPALFPSRIIELGTARFGNDLPFALIAGPCQIESESHTLMMAERLQKIAFRRKIGLVFKGSYDKANRTSTNAKRGVGLEFAVRIFERVKSETGLPVLTDVHESWQCAAISGAVDCLQIPAFLCRQTDLILAAAATGKVVNVKKGQFLAPWDMKHAVAKVLSGGNNKIMLTERGASFGYNTLVTDMRGLPVMRETGAPVVFDATHSVQQPGGLGGSSGGDRRMVPVLARAALAVGVAGVFVETHQDPDNAPSDGPNMVPVDQLETLLEGWQRIDDVAKSILA